MSLSVTIGIATIPEREESLKDTLATLKGQADRIFVYMNGYDRKSGLEYSPPNVTYVFGPDLGDIGKFWRCFQIFPPDFMVTCDDDLLYPPDFVKTLTQAAHFYRCPVSAHGRVIASPTTSYYRGGSLAAYRCLGTVEKDVDVTVIGTGTMCFPTEIIWPTFEDFPHPDMADIWFSKLCQENGVKRMVLEHKEGWIKHTDKIDMSKTIHYTNKRRDTIQTEVFNSVDWQGLSTTPALSY